MPLGHGAAVNEGPPAPPAVNLGPGDSRIALIGACFGRARATPIQVYCVNRDVLVPFFGVRLQMLCVNRDVLVICQPLLSIRKFCLPLFAKNLHINFITMLRASEAALVPGEITNCSSNGGTHPRPNANCVTSGLGIRSSRRSL